MYGAILGDIIGSPFEFDKGDKTKEFPLFSEKSAFTDDTVMTVAVAKAVMDWMDFGTEDPGELVIFLEETMKEYGRLFPEAGYGAMFRQWLQAEFPAPYFSFGNGAAMRVSPIGWLFEDRWTTVLVARISASVTHDHPEGIKGACAVADAIWQARKGREKHEIKLEIQDLYGYNLDRTLDEIRPAYRHVESCQETVPEAIIAFLEGRNFEDVIRNAVSLGGDSDTLTCIAGSIAEAYYGVPEKLMVECRNRLPARFKQMIDRFESKRIARAE